MRYSVLLVWEWGIWSGQLSFLSDIINISEPCSWKHFPRPAATIKVSHGTSFPGLSGVQQCHNDFHKDQSSLTVQAWCANSFFRFWFHVASNNNCEIKFYSTINFSSVEFSGSFSSYIELLVWLLVAHYLTQVALVVLQVKRKCYKLLVLLASKT